MLVPVDPHGGEGADEHGHARQDTANKRDAASWLLELLKYSVFKYRTSRNNNYLCTCDLYRPVHNVLEAWIYITWGSWRGLGPVIPEFFGPCEMVTGA